MAFLKVYSNGEERTVFLADQPVILGRGEDADVLLKDVKASRHHCSIEPGDGGWVARDLGSGNGTRLNGEKIAVRPLSPDDVLKIGDARIVFAGEGAAVMEPAAAPAADDGDFIDLEPEPELVAERPRRSRAERPPARGKGPLVAGVGVLMLFVAFIAWQTMGGSGGGNNAEKEAYAAFRAARTDADVVHQGAQFLDKHLRSPHADEVRAAVRSARERLATTRTDDFDPTAGLQGLSRDASIEKLETLLKEVGPDKRSRVRAALARLRAAETKERDGFFAGIEQDFRAHVKRGEFARAREIWFFLAGEQAWQPIPRRYLDKIVAANGDLESAAVAARSKLLDDASRYEAAYRFKDAIALLAKELPRFAGTSVERSLRDRIETYRTALRRGVDKKASKVPASLVHVDVKQKVAALLARLPKREFAAVAAGLRDLAAEAEKTNDPGHPEIAARARECSAIVALHEAVIARLVAGKVPTRAVARRWRVVSGDAAGVKLKHKGEEAVHAWAAVPTVVYVALLQREAPSTTDGWLGVVAAAHALQGEAGVLPVLAEAYEKSRQRSALDAFVGARVRLEPVPDGGYVVHEGKLITRREFVEKQEQALIAKYREQLAKSYDAIRKDKAFRGLAKLTKRKNALDKARAHAKALIYDQKKYFYPYRGTGREGEYYKVQGEVDQRVAAVRELWDDKRSVSIRSSRSVQKHLKAFDEAARELDKRLVDVAKEVEHVAFLRAYFGRKFTIRTLFRNAEELALLRYSKEVMEANPHVAGDIRDTEREQVRVTNEYRLMFGHQPVRIVDKLVLSSRGHCEEMARIGYFGHYSPTPGRRSPGDRMRLAGYSYGISENCAQGASAPLGAHNQWCHSSGHHRNLLDPRWTEMGTGHHGRLWTQNFGVGPRWSKHDRKDDEDGGAGDGDDSGGLGGRGDGCGDGCGDGDGFDYDDE